MTADGSVLAVRKAAKSSRSRNLDTSLIPFSSPSKLASIIQNEAKALPSVKNSCVRNMKMINNNIGLMTLINTIIGNRARKVKAKKNMNRVTIPTKFSILNVKISSSIPCHNFCPGVKLVERRDSRQVTENWLMHTFSPFYFLKYFTWILFFSGSHLNSNKFLIQIKFKQFCSQSSFLLRFVFYLYCSFFSLVY